MDAPQHNAYEINSNYFHVSSSSQHNNIIINELNVAIRLNVRTAAHEL